MCAWACVHVPMHDCGCPRLQLWSVFVGVLVKSLVCRSHAKAPCDKAERLATFGWLSLQLPEPWPICFLVLERREEKGLTQGQTLN